MRTGKKIRTVEYPELIPDKDGIPVVIPVPTKVPEKVPVPKKDGNYGNPANA